MIYICITDKVQELIEAPNHVTAAASMRNLHDDLDVRGYAASDEEVAWGKRNGLNVRSVEESFS